MNMNGNYIHTVTLYNRILAADSTDKKEHWQKTVLPNCFWKSVIKTGFSETQVNVENTYVVRIPQDDRYLEHGKFIKSPEGHFTVSQGDIAILGICEDEIKGVSGSTAAQILARHKPNAFKITAFSDNTGHFRAKHYRLGG